jgi:putative FmdB family regulatory protein
VHGLAHELERNVLEVVGGNPGDCFGQSARLEFSRKVEAWREVPMPQYEYLCLACKTKFSSVLTLAEHEKGKVKCPKCGSTKVEQQWAAFYPTTSKKS